MFLLDLLGSAAIVAGGGYVAVLGTVEAFRRTRSTFRRAIKTEIVTAQQELAPSSLGAKIADMIRDQPREWEIGPHTLNHVPTGMRIWIANDAAHVCIYVTKHGAQTKADPVTDSLFSNAEKKAIYSAYKKYLEAYSTRVAREARAEVHNMLDQHLSGHQ